MKRKTILIMLVSLCLFFSFMIIDLRRIRGKKCFTYFAICHQQYGMSGDA